MMEMKKPFLLVAAAACAFAAGSYFALAQAPGPQPHAMNFFITSLGMGKGGDLGGLARAGAHCQQLAAAAGAGNLTWHAYLSTQARPGQPAGDARDRVGEGPLDNAQRGPGSHDVCCL